MNKYPYKRPNALMLFIQMLLIILGSAMIISGMIINRKAAAAVQLSRLAMLISFAAMIMYAVKGYRDGRKYYPAVIYAFAASLLLTILKGIPGPESAGTALAFGLTLTAAQKLGAKRQALSLMTLVCAILLIFTAIRLVSIASAGGLTLMKFCNNSAQTVLAGTMEIMYLTDDYREKSSLREVKA